MLLNISHSLLSMTHFIRIGSLSLLVPYRSSLSAFKATSGNLYATHQGLYRQPLVCNASRSHGARKGETSTTWEMKPTWDLLRGGTFNSWGRGRRESGSLHPSCIPGREPFSRKGARDQKEGWDGTTQAPISPPPPGGSTGAPLCFCLDGGHTEHLCADRG